MPGWSVDGTGSTKLRHFGTPSLIGCGGHMYGFEFQVANGFPPVKPAAAAFVS